MSNIYFVAAHSVGMIKIGKATSVHNRILSLQSASPVELELLATIQLDDNYDSLLAEQFFHARHDAYRSHGEWFRISDAIMRDVEAIKVGNFDWRALPKPELPLNGFRQVWIAKRAEAIRKGKAAARARSAN